jgi:shikimate kinase
MGVGKTTVGRMVDSDDAIERTYRATGREIAADSGPSLLHDLEADFLEESIRLADRHVIAAAASVADRPSLLATVTDAGSSIVYLDAGPDTLRRRVERGHHRRPILPDRAAALSRSRVKNALAVGCAHVDTTKHTPEDVADLVLAVVTRSSS